MLLDSIIKISSFHFWGDFDQTSVNFDDLLIECYLYYIVKLFNIDKIIKFLLFNMWEKNQGWQIVRIIEILLQTIFLINRRLR